MHGGSHVLAWMLFAVPAAAVRSLYYIHGVFITENECHHPYEIIYLSHLIYKINELFISNFYHYLS